ESDVEISGDEADDGVAGAAQQSQRRRRRCIVNDSDDDGCNDGEECENANDSDEIDDDDRRENEGSDKACSDDEFEKLDDWAMEHAALPLMKIQSSPPTGRVKAASTSYRSPWTTL
ncbi:hypothetical protein GALMADRAFT_254916, partial [Galerina marginata CBS 339.88]